MWTRLRDCGWNAVRINMCRISGNKTFLWIDQWSIKKLFGGKKKVLFKRILISERANGICSFQNIEQLRQKWSDETSGSKNEAVCENGRKIITTMFVGFMMDTFSIHRLELRIRIISMQIKYRESEKISLQSEDFLKICSPELLGS